MRKKCSYKRKFNKQGESYIEFDNISSLIIKYDKSSNTTEYINKDEFENLYNINELKIA